MTMPIVAVLRPERREWAIPLRRKPSSATAVRTRSTRSCWTCGALLTTRETVLMLTPARLATSTMVGLRGGVATSSCDSGALLVTQTPASIRPAAIVTCAADVGENPSKTRKHLLTTLSDAFDHVDGQTRQGSVVL